MTPEFTDIRITGLDLERTRKSRTYPGLRNVFLSLSETPPRAWSKFFAASRQHPRHQHWRDAWVEGKAIVVDCVPDEIETYHMADLRFDIENANQRYRECLASAAKRAARERDAQAEERARLEDIGKRLGF